MGFFDFFKNKKHIDKKEAIICALRAKSAYDSRDFKSAAKYFAEYFECKGYGNFPELDIDDFRMYLNLMISRFYAQQYQECLKVCEILIRLDSGKSDAYAFSGLCYNKLGNKTKADEFWKKAKARGNEIAKTFESIDDVKMQGYSD